MNEHIGTEAADENVRGICWLSWEDNLVRLSSLCAYLAEPNPVTTEEGGSVTFLLALVPSFLSSYCF